MHKIEILYPVLPCDAAGLIPDILKLAHPIMSKNLDLHSIPIYFNLLIGLIQNAVFNIDIKCCVLCTILRAI